MGPEGEEEWTRDVDVVHVTREILEGGQVNVQRLLLHVEFFGLIVESSPAWERRRRVT